MLLAPHFGCPPQKPVEIRAFLGSKIAEVWKLGLIFYHLPPNYVHCVQNDEIEWLLDKIPLTTALYDFDPTSTPVKKKHRYSIGL